MVHRRVRLVGLTSRQDLNGREAFCESFDGERLTVRIHGGEQVRVRPTNVVLIGDGMDYTAQYDRRHRLADVFAAYDDDRSGSIDSNEFTALVRDILEVHDPRGNSTEEQVGLHATAIASRFQIQGIQGTMVDAVTLEQFIENVLASPSPFDQSGLRLRDVLLSRADDIIDLQNGRRAAADPAPPPPDEWVPTYEWQQLSPQPGAMPRGLEYQMSTNSARIPDYIQAVFRIPSMDNREVRIWAHRNATMAQLCVECVGQWPGLRGRDFVAPTSASLSLWHNGRALDPTATVEQVRLFFIHRQVTVVIDAEGDNQGTAAADVEPDLPPPPSPSVERTSSQVTRYDEISARLRRLETQLDAALSRTNDECLAILDQLTHGAFDEVDLQGLRDSARALRNRTKDAQADGGSGGGGGGGAE